MTEFLEKVKDGLERGAAVVGVRSREVLDAAKLKARIGTLAGRRKDHLGELGGLVYTAYLRDGGHPDGEVAAKCRDIAELDAEIGEREEDLRQIHVEARKDLGLPVCSSCGAPLDEDDLYCRRCGEKVK